MGTLFRTMERQAVLDRASSKRLDKRTGEVGS